MRVRNMQVPYQQREAGYDAVTSYYAGLNDAEEKFQEAQPIFLNYYPDGTKVMQSFVGPTRSGDMLEDPPKPLLAGSRLVASGGELCAVLLFEGYITPDTAAAAVGQLKAALAADGLQLADAEKGGFFRICQYGPVYSFSGRENEVLLKVVP